MTSNEDRQPGRSLGQTEIGQLALQRGLLTPEQLEEIESEQDRQRKTGQEPEPLGQMLLRRQWITAQDLQALIGDTKNQTLDATLDMSILLPTGPPERIDRYVIIREIARGGMGTVYEAHDPNLNRAVAIKVLRETVPHSTNAQRLYREASIAARLTHPGIIGIHEVGSTTVDGYETHFIVMDLVEGATLRDSWKTMKFERKLSILAEVSSAVGHAHEQGVVHRDLKPSNILMQADGQPIVSDFGLARRTQESLDLTRTGAVLGTDQYMAPEQVRGRSKEIGPPTDVWALGVMLYQILSDTYPFGGKTLAELYEQIEKTEPIRPRAIQPGLSRDLETICLKALEKVPERRYPSASQMSRDLSLWQHGEPIGARPPSLSYRLSRFVLRHRAASLATLLAILILTVAGGLLGWRALREGQDAAGARNRLLEQILERVEDSLAAAGPLRQTGAIEPMREVAGEAIEACREAIREIPNRAEPHHLLGLTLRILMRHPEALQAQDEAVLRDPNHSRALYERAVLHLILREEQIDRRVIEQLLASKTPVEDRSRPRRIQILASDPEADRFSEKLRADLDLLANTVHQSALGPARNHWVEGIRAWQRDDHEAAIAALRKAQTRTPELVEVTEALARIQMARGDHLQAILTWSRLERDAGYAPFRTGRALALIEQARSLEPEKKGDALALYRAAQEDLKRSERLEPRIGNRYAPLHRLCEFEIQNR